jgi:hypothetical protein
MALILAFFFVALGHPWIALGFAIGHEVRRWIPVSQNIDFPRH